MSFVVVIPPTVEPITLEEARMHLRLTADSNNDSPPVYSHPEDSLVLTLISAARDYCEQNLMRSLASQTVETVLDDFPVGGIQLVGSPIVQIVSITYVDPDGNQQTLESSAYLLDNTQEPGWVLPQTDTPWPVTAGTANAVRVRYETGYSSDSPSLNPIPPSIRHAMFLLIGNWYENREAVNIGGGSSGITYELQLGVNALLKPYQLRLSMA